MQQHKHLSRLLTLVSLLAACYCAKLDVQAGKVVQQVRKKARRHAVLQQDRPEC